MTKSVTNDFEPFENENFNISENPNGIIEKLGELKPNTVITEAGLALLFSRHVISVKRAVERGELPPPCRLFGNNTWTIRVLIKHIESRLEQAAKEVEQTGRRLSEHLP